MTIDDMERLIRRLERSDITAFTFTDAATRLELQLAPAAGRRAAVPEGATPAASAPETPARTLRALAIGRLRLRHPEAAPVEERFPRAVARGDIVAFLDVGTCLRPVVAEADGMIGAPLQLDGTLVGYGTPLFPLV